MTQFEAEAAFGAGLYPAVVSLLEGMASTPCSASPSSGPGHRPRPRGLCTAPRSSGTRRAPSSTATSCGCAAVTRKPALTSRPSPPPPGRGTGPARPALVGRLGLRAGPRPGGPETVLGQFARAGLLLRQAMLGNLRTEWGGSQLAQDEVLERPEHDSLSGGALGTAGHLPESARPPPPPLSERPPGGAVGLQGPDQGLPESLRPERAGRPVWTAGPTAAAPPGGGGGAPRPAQPGEAGAGQDRDLCACGAGTGDAAGVRRVGRAPRGGHSGSARMGDAAAAMDHAMKPGLIAGHTGRWTDSSP